MWASFFAFFGVRVPRLLEDAAASQHKMNTPVDIGSLSDYTEQGDDSDDWSTTQGDYLFYVPDSASSSDCEVSLQGQDAFVVNSEENMSHLHTAVPSDASHHELEAVHRVDHLGEWIIVDPEMSELSKWRKSMHMKEFATVELSSTVVEEVMTTEEAIEKLLTPRKGKLTRNKARLDLAGLLVENRRLQQGH